MPDRPPENIQSSPLNQRSVPWTSGQGQGGVPQEAAASAPTPRRRSGPQGESPSPGKKEHKKRNRRPDIQLYVPRSRRQAKSSESDTPIPNKRSSEPQQNEQETAQSSPKNLIPNKDRDYQRVAADDCKDLEVNPERNLNGEPNDNCSFPVAANVNGVQTHWSIKDNREEETASLGINQDIESRSIVPESVDEVEQVGGDASVSLPTELRAVETHTGSGNKSNEGLIVIGSNSSVTPTPSSFAGVNQSEIAPEFLSRQEIKETPTASSCLTDIEEPAPKLRKSEQQESDSSVCKDTIISRVTDQDTAEGIDSEPCEAKIISRVTNQDTAEGIDSEPCVAEEKDTSSPLSGSQTMADDAGNKKPKDVGDGGGGVGVGKNLDSGGGDGSKVGDGEKKEELKRNEGEEEEEEEEDSWDTMFDDEGNSLKDDEIKELTEAVGGVSVSVKKAVLDYSNFSPKDTLDYSKLEHVIEAYDIPEDFKTQDLAMSFSAFKSKGFDIKWVDDTHALVVFATAQVAEDALGLSNPMLQTRPLSLATKQSKQKARGVAEFLQPYKPRPETSSSAARRMVSSALGIRTNVSKEQRAAERQKLKDAKDKRRQEKQQKDDVWEGSI